MQTTTAIDMLDPAETCERLRLDDKGLLDLVNGGRLAAYDLGGNIRFKVADVVAVGDRLVAA